mmetsp:Transcript_33843/g.86507  ORF Transcript_33843/g.86507 Transcript_33843/m.86507 type:complete len:361 (-) Transcript_33843:164-1246(-)
MPELVEEGPPAVHVAGARQPGGAAAGLRAMLEDLHEGASPAVVLHAGRAGVGRHANVGWVTRLHLAGNHGCRVPRGVQALPHTHRIHDARVVAERLEGTARALRQFLLLPLLAAHGLVHHQPQRDAMEAAGVAPQPARLHEVRDVGGDAHGCAPHQVRLPVAAWVRLLDGVHHPVDPELGYEVRIALQCVLLRGDIKEPRGAVQLLQDEAGPRPPIRHRHLTAHQRIVVGGGGPPQGLSACCHSRGFRCLTRHGRLAADQVVVVREKKVVGGSDAVDGVGIPGPNLVVQKIRVVLHGSRRASDDFSIPASRDSGQRRLLRHIHLAPDRRVVAPRGGPFCQGFSPSGRARHAAEEQHRDNE